MIDPCSRPVATVRALAALAIATTLAAGVEAGWKDPTRDPRYYPPCHTEWPFAQDPPLELSRRCVAHWLVLSYGAGWTADDLDLDAAGCMDPNPGIRVADARRMIRHLDKACAAATTEAGRLQCGRALEALDWFVRQKAGFDDSRSEVAIDAAPVFAVVLAGSPLAPAMLRTPEGGYSPAMLRKLRNAVYARHGKAFASADLQGFFYGSDAVERWTGVARAPKVDPAYGDHLLTAVDKANLAAIQAAERRAPR
jgi:hypothetical protein